MGLAYQLADGMIRFVTTDDVDFDAGLQVLQEALHTAAELEPGRRWHLLFDIRHSSEDRSSDELRTIATLIGDYRKELSGRCAVVVTDPLHYGLGRMFGTFMEKLGVETMVSRRLDEAQDWLRSVAPNHEA